MIKLNNKKTESLMEAILSLRDIKEAKIFFRDLMTEQEIVEFGNRWQAAQMLYNNIPYSEIETKTGLSSRTIARVAKWLNKGKGYLLMIKKADSHHHNASSRKELC